MPQIGAKIHISEAGYDEKRYCYYRDRVVRELRRELFEQVGDVLMSGGAWAVKFSEVMEVPRVDDYWTGTTFYQWVVINEIDEIALEHEYQIYAIEMPTGIPQTDQETAKKQEDIDIDAVLEKMLEWECEYCGTAYTPRGNTNCPNCGGVRPAEHQIFLLERDRHGQQNRNRMG